MIQQKKRTGKVRIFHVKTNRRHQPKHTTALFHSISQNSLYTHPHHNSPPILNSLYTHPHHNIPPVLAGKHIKRPTTTVTVSHFLTDSSLFTTATIAMNPRIGIFRAPFMSEQVCKYTVNFLNSTALNVTVTSNARVVKRWLKTTIYHRRLHENRHVVGLAVQWNPRKGIDPPADTLQLCVGTRCLIYQLSHANTVPSHLYQFLMNGRNKFVGICNYQDERKLRMNRGLNIHRLLDLRNYAENRNGVSMMGNSFGEIAAEYLGYPGLDLDPNLSLSAWDAYFLHDYQVVQASVKAYVASEVGKRMNAWRLI